MSKESRRRAAIIGSIGGVVLGALIGGGIVAATVADTFTGRDKDQRLANSTLILYAEKITGESSYPRLFREAFNKADTNSDGELSQAENREVYVRIDHENIVYGSFNDLSREQLKQYLSRG